MFKRKRSGGAARVGAGVVCTMANACLVLIVGGCANGTRDSGNSFADQLRYPQISLLTVLGETRSLPDADALNRAVDQGGRPPRELRIVPPGGTGGGVVIGEPRDAAAGVGWAALIDKQRTRAFFDVLSSSASYRHIASPALLLPPRQWGEISWDSVDKARATVGSRLEFLADPSSDAVGLTMRWATPDHAPIATTDRLVIPEGYVLAAVIPPGNGQTTWRALLVNPSVIRGAADYPFQTATSLSR